MKLGAINTKSFLLTGCVLALVIALFFIPEIIGFQKSISGGPAQQQASNAPMENVVSGGYPGGAGSTSPLEKISDMVNYGKFDPIRAHDIARDISVAQHPAGPAAATVFSWKNIRSGASMKALKAADRETRSIIKSLPPDKGGTRYALYNFLSALALGIENSGEKNITPQEFVGYLDYAQLSAGRSMLSEGVDSATYNNFLSMPLGPVIDTNRGERLSQRLTPFNPQVSLSKIDVEGLGFRIGPFGDNRSLGLRIYGTLKGRDIRRVEILNNGNFVRMMNVGFPDHHGVMRFISKRMHVQGVFTIRVVDRAGQMWEKSYQFYPRIKKFPFKNGRFQIPFEPGSPEYDKFFLFRPGQLSAAIAYGAPEESYDRF